MAMYMNEKKIVQILKQDHFGDGIAQGEDGLIFVERGLPQEQVEIHLTEKKKHFERGVIDEIKSCSSERVEPACPYFGRCGGCQLQHQSEEGQKHFKMQKVKELLMRYASYQGPIEPLKTGSHFHYRNKVILEVKDRKLCYHQGKSDQLVPIDYCLLLPVKMNSLIASLSTYLKKESAFQKIQIRMNEQDEFLLSIEGSFVPETLLSYLDEFKIKVLYKNQQIVYQSGPFEMKLFNQVFTLSDQSFFQVNSEMTSVLYEQVIEEVRKKKPKVLLDLYCGTGTLGLIASPYCSQVIGVEVVSSAIQNALLNKEQNQVSNITFYEGKVEDVIATLPRCDFVIVDPPRKGLDEKTKETLLRIQPDVICYVSCDPVTFARDLKTLTSIYTIEKITPIDLFPQTYHVECVGVLYKNK